MQVINTEICNYIFWKHALHITQKKKNLSRACGRENPVCDDFGYLVEVFVGYGVSLTYITIIIILMFHSDAHKDFTHSLRQLKENNYENQSQDSMGYFLGNQRIFSIMENVPCCLYWPMAPPMNRLKDK